MAEYIIRTDKPERLGELLHLHGIHHYEARRLKPHGRLIDAEDVIKHWQGAMKVVDRYSMRKFLDEVPAVLEAST